MQVIYYFLKTHHNKNMKLPKIKLPSSKLPIIGYIKRYWILLAVITILIWAYTSGALALTMRGALLIPIFTLIAGASALLLRNVYNRKTTDKYVDEKDLIKNDWENLTPFQRIAITKAEFLIYFFGGSIIAAGLVIIINV
jgi:hypothetical protein